MAEESYRFNTLQLHGGQEPDPTTKSRAVPIYQTTSYQFENCDEGEALFGLRKNGNIYTRMMNPTTDVFEKRMALLEGGIGALAVASGSSAIMYSIINLASQGDEIVAANTLYGGTYHLFADTLEQFGIHTVFVVPNQVENFEKAVTDQTKAIYIESIGNPSTNIIDIEAVAKIAHKHKIPLIVDNTFGSPYLIRPFEFGADIVVHSATKYIGGHGTSIGGVVVDSGKFDWAASGKFPRFTEPDVSYNNMVYTRDVGAAAYITKMRVTVLRDTGAALSPFNSFLFLQGLETLSLRVQRHTENAEIIAEFLEKHPKVAWVNYPGLKSSPYYALKEKYFPKGAGAIFTFGIKGGKEAARNFIDRLKLFSILANVADAKSLVIHPSSTTHQQMSIEEQEEAGITEDMIRLSIGIEDIEDLLDDIKQAFGD